MALLYWRPFINDGHNQGLKKSQSLSSLTFNNNGKFGKCLELTNYLDLQVNPLDIDVYEQSDTEASYSLWVKIDKDYINDLIANGINGLLETKSDKVIINRIMGFNSSSTSSGSYIDFTSGSDIQLTSQSQLNTAYFIIGLRHDTKNVYQSYSFNLNQWYHIVVTYDKLNNLKYYINGELMFQDQISHHALNSAISNKKFVLNANRYMGALSANDNRICISLKEYFNDVRIYNHALSAEEVKEISKGLILHYHLSGENTVIVPPEYQQLEYLESTSERTQWINTGIVPTDNFEYRFKYALRGYVAKTYHGPFGAFSGQDYKATRLIDNNGSATTVLLYFRSKASGGSKSVKIAQTDMTDNIIEGKISKNSYYLKNLTSNEEFFSTTPFANTGEEDNTTTMKLFGSGPNPGSGTVTKSYTRIYYFDTYNNGVCIQKLIPVKRLSDNVLGLYDVITGTFLTNAGSGTFTAGPNITITGTVYDSSGYNNNGTVVESLTAAAGSPRYGVATNFSGSNGFTYDHFVTSDSKLNECTFSVWIKRTYTDATNRYLFYGPFYVYLYSNFAIRIGWEAENEEGTHSSNGWSTGTSTNIIAVNTWTHIAITFKKGSFIYYINGVQKSTSSRRMFIRGYQNISSSNENGGVGNSFIGGISDLRFYMTALSATEIKELYDSSMVVDSNGNMTPRGVS